jgi:hypothetical protein
MDIFLSPERSFKHEKENYFQVQKELGPKVAATQKEGGICAEGLPKC